MLTRSDFDLTTRAVQQAAGEMLGQANPRPHAAHQMARRSLMLADERDQILAMLALARKRIKSLEKRLGGKC